MATVKITIPSSVVYVLNQLTAVVGKVIGCPLKIALKELGKDPVNFTEGYRWRQVIDVWRPGLYVRAYAVGIWYNGHGGDGCEFIGARLRFTHAQEVRQIFAGGLVKVQKSLIWSYNNGRVEAWIAGEDGIADALCNSFGVWEGRLPEELFEFLHEEAQERVRLADEALTGEASPLSPRFLRR